MEVFTPQFRAETIDYLWDTISVEVEGLEWEKYTTIISNLCERMIIERIVTNDEYIVYKAKTGFNWSDVTSLPDAIERRILLELIENPRCFFVLVNTQKGKLRISGKEMASWAVMPDKRIVSFLVVDNDRTLSEQSVNGLFSCFPVRPGFETSVDPSEKYNVRIFELSSNNKTSLREITTYIDAYAYNPSYAMPIIVLLANARQMEKFVQLLQHIKTHSCNRLYSGTVWDEADKTYPPFRERNFTISGKQLNFLQFVNDPNGRIFRNGLVTATEGDLIDNDEYPECANAYHYPPEIDSEDEENYFAIHHPECEKKLVNVRSGESNNTIAKRILNEHYNTHFNKAYTLATGEKYYPKIILHSNPYLASIASLAKELRDKFHVLTFNTFGITLYTSNGPENGKKYSARKQNLNRLLFYIYKMNGLNDKPLIVMGRRKVDRGLGFHYAPRKRGQPTKLIPGKDGDLQTDGIEGLIWTDMIMGNRIIDLSQAKQKVGRGAGIIRQCPQYPGKFTYWIDDETARVVERHYKMVEKLNEIRGSNTIQQAVQQAEAAIPITRRNHNVDLSTFRVVHCPTPQETLDITKKIIEEIFGESYRKPQRDQSTQKFKTSLNTKGDIVDLLDAIKKVPTSYGTNNNTKTYRRYLPCYKSETFYTVIPLIDPKYTDSMKANLDTKFNNFLVNIPQEEIS
jgi:hypothetical protein